MKIAAAQIRPHWMNKQATLRKAIDTIEEAARLGVELVVFPEAFLSGYPFWLCRTNAASFEDHLQSQAYAQFIEAAVEADGPEITQLVEAARDHKVSVFMGMNERGTAVGRGSIYCALLKIDAEQGLLGIHRKMTPTHDERLCWAPGDAQELKTHKIGGFRVGGLCCWENWMPLARFTLYCGGEELHISIWPGNAVVAENIVASTAREGGVWSLSVHGLLSMSDVADDFVFKKQLIAEGYDLIFCGGSALYAPGGAEVSAPAIGVEGLICHDIDLAEVYAARHFLDITGHYHRADIFDLKLRGSRFTEASLRD